MDYYAISQCLPGIIAVNTSLFIGNKIKGTLGSIAAVLGVVPVAGHHHGAGCILSNFAEVELVRHAFAGIHVCVFVLIANCLEAA